MQYLEVLKATATRSISALQYLADNGHKSYNEFVFDIETLKDYSNVNITESIEYKDTFERLMKITGPVLYWFEVIPGYEQSRILERLESYKNNDNLRATPAIKKNVDLSSNILYVGKVKNLFYGRVIQHLGFFTTSKTQGLQLFHWLKNEPVKLKLHVCEFEPDMVELVGMIEIEFARELKPLIGKHK